MAHNIPLMPVDAYEVPPA